MQSENHLEELNPQQREAATHTTGPLLVVAGAGAGKTKTIAHRILHLVREGVPAHRILAITFTNKAAKEMRDRVAHLLGGADGRLQRAGADSRFKILDSRSGVVPGSNVLGGADGKLQMADGMSEPGSNVKGQMSYVRTAAPFVSTFHSLGVQLIKENAALLGTTRYFTILDKGESLSLVKRALKSLGMNPKEEEPQVIAAVISREKNKLVTMEDFASAESESWRHETILKVWRKYEEMLREEKAFDFDDLLLKPVLMLRTHPEVLARYQERWQYIHIDEYQDTNVVQYELSRMLAQKHGNICVVGDTDQSVYGWRGADYRNILNFEENFPGAHTVVLEENYRSTQIILATANEVIKKNKLRKEKNLFTKRGEGEKISLFEAFDEADEARHVARALETLLGKGVPAIECAVLYRANFQSRILEEALLTRGVPYQVLGTKFYDRKEVKDVLAFVRVAMNPSDKEALARIVNVPPRGIGAVSLEKILAGREHELPEKMRAKLRDFRAILGRVRETLLGEKVSNALKTIIRISGLEKVLSEGSDEDQERLENLKELVTIATKYDALPQEEALDAFLTETALLSDQDSIKESGKGSGVKLMTIHASKGLEFAHVFIVGLEEGLFPHERLGSTRNAQEEQEEERRLFYVALTRAKDRLHLSYATSRTIFGQRRSNIPSSFLEDVSDEVLDFESSVGNRAAAFREPWEEEDTVMWESLGRR